MKDIKRKSIRIITDNDLCVSCGGCTHACARNNIEMRLDDYQGKWLAAIQDAEKCKKCHGEKFCLSVCPSYDVDYMSLAESNQNRLLGKIKRVYNGFSRNPDIRFSSSTGGFVRELCKMLLDAGEINGIISITHDGGLEYTPKIVNDISLMPNSIYHDVNFENAIDLLKKAEGRYLVIGVPCQMTSIELFTNKKKYRHLKEKIYAKVGLICGYIHDRNYLKAAAYYNKFEFSEIIYRCRGR